MKNLKQLAATFSLYTVEDIPSNLREEFSNRINNGLRDAIIPPTLEILLISNPDYEVGVFFNCEGNVVEDEFILFKKKDSELLLMMGKQWKTEKYLFSPYHAYRRKYNQISNRIKDARIAELKEPNKIGDFTRNKVEAWVKYCEDYIAACEKCFVEINTRNAEIEKQIQDFIDANEGCKVTKGGNNYSTTKSTYVDTPLFTVIFEHNKAEKFLGTKIVFKGELADVTKISGLIKYDSVHELI